MFKRLTITVPARCISKNTAPKPAGPDGGRPPLRRRLSLQQQSKPQDRGGFRLLLHRFRHGLRQGKKIPHRQRRAGGRRRSVLRTRQLAYSQHLAQRALHRRGQQGGFADEVLAMAPKDFLLAIGDGDGAFTGISLYDRATRKRDVLFFRQEYTGG